MNPFLDLFSLGGSDKYPGRIHEDLSYDGSIDVDRYSFCCWDLLLSPVFLAIFQIAGIPLRPRGHCRRHGEAMFPFVLFCFVVLVCVCVPVCLCFILLVFFAASLV